MRPATAEPFPMPDVLEPLYPICEAITPQKANGSEIKQHMKPDNGDNTENDMEMIPRTIPAVALPLLGKTPIIMP